MCTTIHVVSSQTTPPRECTAFATICCASSFGCTECGRRWRPRRTTCATFAGVQQSHTPSEQRSREAPPGGIGSERAAEDGAGPHRPGRVRWRGSEVK